MNPIYPILAVPALLLLVLSRPANAPTSTEGVWHLRHGARPVAKPRPRPRPEPALVAQLSKKWSPVFGVPVSWLRSQAWAESRNVTSAVNPTTGAMGVLQILPVTAKWLVASLRKSKLGKSKTVGSVLSRVRDLEDLLDPDVNVMLAAYYLRVLKNKFGADHELVAAAYDAGPNKIAYYVDRGMPLPPVSQAYVDMVAEAKSRGFI